MCPARLTCKIRAVLTILLNIYFFEWILKDNFARKVVKRNGRKCRIDSQRICEPKWVSKIFGWNVTKPKIRNNFCVPPVSAKPKELRWAKTCTRHLHIGIEYTMFVRKFLGKQFYETFFCFLIWGYYSTVPQFWKKWLDWVRLATEHSGMFKRTWSELKGNMSELWCSVANPSLKVPDFQFLCMAVHVHCNCPFVWPYSCSFAFAFYLIASPRHERIDRERRVARMRPKKRELLYMNWHTVHRNGKIWDY